MGKRSRAKHNGTHAPVPRFSISSFALYRSAWMLHRARKKNVIATVPGFALFKEWGRSLRLNDTTERSLLAVAEQPVGDIIVVMRDTGQRNARELYRMRVEHLDFEERTISIPDSKTQSGKRCIPMSDRVGAF